MGYRGVSRNQRVVVLSGTIGVCVYCNAGMYVGMLVSIVACRYYVRYSVANSSLISLSMSIPPAVLRRVDVEACVCVASGIRCGLLWCSVGDEKSSWVESRESGGCRIEV